MSYPAQVDSWDFSDDEGDFGDDEFNQGWMAGKNAVPPCCLHGDDCPERRPQSWWRRALAALRGSS